MKTRYLTAACILIEAGNSKLLFDPWLGETAFHGAWAHDPLIAPEWSELQDITGIVVSHLHHDHMDIETLVRLPRVPIYIPKFDDLPMATILRARGLDVRECSWWMAQFLDGLAMTPLKPSGGELDSAWFVTDGDYHVLNLVDCSPLEMEPIYKFMRGTGQLHLDGCPIAIDELYFQYAASGPYPHCFVDLSTERILAERDRIESEFLQRFADVTRRLQPKRVIPFAVGYRLRGRLDCLNPMRPIPKASKLADRPEFSGLPLWLRPQEYALANAFDIEKHAAPGFEPLDYELLDIPDAKTLDELFRRAHDSWQQRALKHHQPIPQDWELEFSMGATKFTTRTSRATKYWHRFILDPRQLYMLLTRQMHWDNALGSSQILMERSGAFDRQLYRALSYFHV